MIKSFRHKGLKKFYQKGDCSGLEQSLVPRLKNRLSMLDAAKTIDFLNQQGYDLHELKGDRAETWSIKVSGNSGRPGRKPASVCCRYEYRPINRQPNPER